MTAVRSTRRLATWSLSMALLGLLVGGCASNAPQVPAPVLAGFDRAAAVAAVRSEGLAAGGELEIQPLRDPQVEDLREQAAALEQRGAILAAGETLDQALAISIDDPALLQERAEIALLLGDVDGAERMAQRAFELGAQVGPLCRRHWETLAQVRSARPAAPASAPAEPGASVAAARARRDACTVAPPDRF